MRNLVHVFFPVTTIKLAKIDLDDRVQLDTVQVDAPGVGVRPGLIERLDTAITAKKVSCCMGVESVFPQVIFTTDQVKILSGYSQVDVSGHIADRTITAPDFDRPWQQHYESHPSAVALSLAVVLCHSEKPWLCMATV
jgi:hypothetical protein